MSASRFLRWSAPVERIAASLWVGGLCVTGYLVVPILFASLDDRQLAGRLAGSIFQLMSYVGLLAGAYLLSGVLIRSGQRRMREWRVWALVAMLALVATGAFVLQPMMQELKASGIIDGSVQAATFGRLHGVSSVLFMATSLLGLWLVGAGVQRR
ncbi:MAG: DUF4149 domain-containing protein [Gammaproteobacteria bacterium]|nr:DUF4149 domain-containing protein [Gammaproteobacteria bacterium]